MVKIIYSDGCSMMAGSEHKSWKLNPETGYEECDTTWPALIKKIVFPKSKLYSRASTGSSNYGIARRTVYSLNKILQDYPPEDILVCIMWTSMYRKDYRIEHEENENKLETNDEYNYITTLPTDNLISFSEKPAGAIADYNHRKNFLRRNNLLEISNSYYKNLNHPVNFTYDSFVQIEYTNLFLKHNNIKSIQCFGFGDHYYYQQQNNKDVYTDDIIKRCQQYKIYSIDLDTPQGFYEWAARSYDLGPGLHPLELAHKQWARQMMRKL